MPSTVMTPTFTEPVIYNTANFMNPVNVYGLEEQPTESDKIYDLFSYYASPHFVSIDNWIPSDYDKTFYTTKNAIILPIISDLLELSPDDPNRINVDSFNVTPKRCYNGEDIREHITRYLNYFCKFYDKENELILHFYRIKRLIDFGVIALDGTKYPYTEENFLRDIKAYILGPSMYAKVNKMNEQNYSLKLSYKNKSNQALQYNDTHGKIFMEISFFMNVLIPLICHYVYRNKITNTTDVDDLFQTVYQYLFDRHADSVDLKAKLFETANTTIARDQKTNKDLWDKSEIRGMDIAVNSLDAVDTLVLQVMPKYKFNQNMVMYNFTSIRNTAIQYAVGIAYEYDLVPLSSSKRDGEDSTSQFDKFEATLAKVDEAKFLQNSANAKVTMKHIENTYGPFTQDKIEFYRKEMSKGGKSVINNFQLSLLFVFFAKMFGSVIPMKTINLEQYIELAIASKNILNAQCFVVLPEILSGRVVKLTTRTILNKKEIMMIESSQNWEAIRYKYMDNQQTLDKILSQLATILSSDFQIIDYDDVNECASDLNGRSITINSAIANRVIEEYLLFCLMI